MKSQHPRRTFLQSLGAAVVGAHLDVERLMGAPGRPGHRIAECQLVTTASLESMEAFYGGRLGLETRRSLGRLIVTAGDTQIAFSEDRQASDPFYHFAFNIPENKIVAAREWQ